MGTFRSPSPTPPIEPQRARDVLAVVPSDARRPLELERQECEPSRKHLSNADNRLLRGEPTFRPILAKIFGGRLCFAGPVTSAMRRDNSAAIHPLSCRVNACFQARKSGCWIMLILLARLDGLDRLDWPSAFRRVGPYAAQVAVGFVESFRPMCLCDPHCRSSSRSIEFLVPVPFCVFGASACGGVKSPCHLAVGFQQVEGPWKTQSRRHAGVGWPSRFRFATAAMPSHALPPIVQGSAKARHTTQAASAQGSARGFRQRREHQLMLSFRVFLLQWLVLL